MSAFQIAALLISATALFSYVNHRWLQLPTTIGVMLMALLVSLGLIGLDRLGFAGLEQAAAQIVRSVQFNETLMQGMLSFLLFAGALHIDLNELAQNRVPVAVLAIGGVAVSMTVFGLLIYGLLQWLNLNLPLAYCFLLGALISPTDPIAVLSVLKSVKTRPNLVVIIAGESLFNDGVGVVAFMMMTELVGSGRGFSAGRVAVLFTREALGGVLFGLASGWLVYQLLKSVDNYQVEILLTLALVAGGYALATALGLSGPIATVVAGLLIGNHGRRWAMSQNTRQNLDKFWELMDEIMNAVLFLLIGLEVLLLAFTTRLLLAGVASAALLLGARWVSVAAPLSLMRLRRNLGRGGLTIMTWGGLRGGISVALALSLPPSPQRETIVALTYAVVVVSILGQGPSLRPLLKFFTRPRPAA